MSPISKWEELTDDEEAIKVLREVYEDDIEKLDLNVGLHAEKKIKGFAIAKLLSSSSSLSPPGF